MPIEEDSKLKIEHEGCDKSWVFFDSHRDTATSQLAMQAVVLQLPSWIKPIWIGPSDDCLQSELLGRNPKVEFINYFTCKKSQGAKARARLKAQLSQFPPIDLVQANSASGVFEAKRCFGSGTPLIWDMQKKSENYLLGKMAAKWANACIAPVKARAAACHAPQNSKFHLLDSAIEFLRYSDRQLSRQQYTFGSLLASGASRHEYQDLLHAIKMLRAQGRNEELLLRVEGTPEKESKLLEQLLSLKGVKQDSDGTTREDFFDRLKVLILPSRQQPDFLLLRQAMTRSLAVVTTRTSGIEELIENGVNAWLSVPGDAKGMFKACRFLSANPNIAADMADRAYKAVQAQGQAKDLCAGLFAVYSQHADKRWAQHVAQLQSREQAREERQPKTNAGACEVDLSIG